MKKKSVRILISSIITAIFAVIGFYISLPAINLQNSEFWTFLLYGVAVYAMSYAILKAIADKNLNMRVKGKIKKSRGLVIGICVFSIPLLILVVGSLASSTFFNANAYAKENDIEIKSFLEYIYNNKPVDDFTDRIESFVHKIKQQEFNRKEYSTVNIHDQDTFRRGKLEAFPKVSNRVHSKKPLKRLKIYY